MKIISLKKRLFLAVSTMFACIILACSIFIIASKKEDTETIAVGNYSNNAQFISSLVNTYKYYPPTYSILDYYPLAAENQTISKYCWIYASLKTLESSFMIQKNEYHNFSEMGTAYLNFTKETIPNNNIELKFMDLGGGKFDDFLTCSKKHGLVYENSFSNDLYFDINESNYENYNYINDYVDETIMKGVVNIDFSLDPNFAQVFSSDVKIQVLKEYITNYGGVFAGIDPGIIINENSIYVRTSETSYSENDGYISRSHAVCLVGWNSNAFLALNSWGALYDLFWIPFENTNIFADLHGYVFNDTITSKLSDISSTAGGIDGFSSKVNNRFIDQKNLFIKGEKISLEYQVNDIDNFNKIFIYIYKGTEDVTDKFLIEFFEEDNRIKISANNSATSSDGYIIKFYDNNTLIGFRDLYVFYGNELSYVQLVYGDKDKTKDSVLFNNNFASGIYSQTYYFYSEYNISCFLDLYLPRFNSYNKNNNFIVSKDVYEIVNGELIANSSIYTFDVDTGTKSNFFRVKIENLSDNNEGKTILIKIKLASRITSATTDYYFIFNINSAIEVSTSNSHRIVYNMDGGNNNLLNINRYPNYELVDLNDINGYKLLNPSKYNSDFIGWYLDPKFTVAITEIGPNISDLLGKIPYYDENMNLLGYYSQLLKKEYIDDIVIYAKWESVDVEYFDIEFDIEKITSHSNSVKNYTGQTIIYGDSVTLKLVFTPFTDNLTSYKYITEYEYYFENQLVSYEYLDEAGESVEFLNSYWNDNLVCGSYTANVVVTMIISHQFSVEKEMTLTYTVDKKRDVTVSYDANTLEYTYDKKEHIPTVSFKGVYNEDLDQIQSDFEFNRSYALFAGKYYYNIKSINNSNYELLQINNPDTELIIYQKELSINYSNTEKVYNGDFQFPDYTISGTIDDEYVSGVFAEKQTLSQLNMKNVGEYEVLLVGVSDSNYKLRGDISPDCIFKITKASITISFDDITERFTVAPNNRKQVTWRVDGQLYDPEDSLGITYFTNGENATASGKYSIMGYLTGTNTVNSNYDITFNDGVYTILGYYYVYYTLPNGEIYVETVEEGQNPVGITEDVYKLPLFSKFEYDKELVGNGLTDLTVKVTVTSYAWAVWIGAGVCTIVVLYLTLTRNERKNKTR